MTNKTAHIGKSFRSWILLVMLVIIAAIGFGVYQKLHLTAQDSNTVTQMATDTTPPATGTTPQQSTGDVTVTDADNGKTVTMSLEQQLVVRLASTNWVIGDPENAAILKQSGQPSIAPASGCVVGSACGTITARFVALTRGSTTVSASRQSCGEAMRCTGTQGQFQVTVTVE